MVGKILGPRKRRTRQHVIVDLSVHHVEGFILQEGHTPYRLSPDYGYDLVLFTHDEQGYLEPGSVYIQLKAAETLQPVGSDLCVQNYFSKDVARQPKKGAKTVCVLVPERQPVNRRAVAKWRVLKEAA